MNVLTSRGLEHAGGAGDRHGAGYHRGRIRIWPFLSWRASIPPGPRPHPNADVPEAFCGRSSDDFPDAHARPILVHTSGADCLGRGTRHANAGDPDCGVWSVNDAPWLGLGTFRV